MSPANEYANENRSRRVGQGLGQRRCQPVVCLMHLPDGKGEDSRQYWRLPCGYPRDYLSEREVLKHLLSVSLRRLEMVSRMVRRRNGPVGREEVLRVFW